MGGLGRLVYTTGVRYVGSESQKARSRSAPFRGRPSHKWFLARGLSQRAREVRWEFISVTDPRSGSIVSAAVEYAAVTERVALKVAYLEGSGDSERAYILATEAFHEELEKVSISGRVALLHEQRLDEKGRVRAPKSQTGILSLGDIVGAGGPEADLAVEPVEGLQLSVKGQEGRSRRWLRRRGAACLGRQTCI